MGLIDMTNKKDDKNGLDMFVAFGCLVIIIVIIGIGITINNDNTKPIVVVEHTSRNVVYTHIDIGGTMTAELYNYNDVLIDSSTETIPLTTKPYTDDDWFGDYDTTGFWESVSTQIKYSETVYDIIEHPSETQVINKYRAIIYADDGYAIISIVGFGRRY